MIEITLTEMALFAWAVLATAAMFKYKDEARSLKRMMVMFIESKEAREQLVAAHAKFMEERS
jgi:hypothetical protein